MSIVTRLKRWFSEMRRRYFGRFGSAGTTTPTPTPTDTTPDAFSFTSVTNAALSTVYTSNTITVSGVTPATSIVGSLSGTGFTYSKNGGAYQAPGSFTFQNGDTFTLRGTSSGAYSTGETAVLSLGIMIGNWQLTTAAAPATISAPTYALHTASGASPASWDVAGDSTFQPGMWVHQQFASDSGFTASLVDYYTEVNGQDWEATSETIGGGASAGIAGAVQTFVQPTGTYFTRCRFETTPGDSTYNITSAWSNTVTDTIVASTAILNAATKNSGLTLSGSPVLSYLAQAGFGKQGVRSTIEQASNKAQFEVTVTANAAFVIGLDDGTTSFPAGSAQPGLDNSLGIGVNFAAGNGEIDIVWNSFGNFQQILGAGIWTTGDVFTIVMDKTAHTIEVWRTRSGSTTQMGTTSSSLTALSHYYAYMSASNVAAAGTFNFGGTTYAKTPGSGVATLWA